MVDSIFIVPRSGVFDVSRVEHHLRQLPDVCPDPICEGKYLLCGAAAAVTEYRSRRLADPTRFPFVVIISVAPTEVNVFLQYADQDQRAGSQAFVAWLLSQQSCAIHDDLRSDWTPIVAKSGVQALFT